MKKNFILLMVLIPLICLAKGHWQVQNPLPTESWLKTICPVTDDIIFAGGMGGTIMKSTDGGETWDIKKFQGFFDIKQIWFSDVSTGWFLSSDKIFKTEDGGDIWFEVELAFDMTSYFIVSMAYYEKSMYLLLRPKTVAIWELPFATSAILKSTDKGNTWQCLNLEIKGKMLCNSFVNDSCGFFYTEEKVSNDSSAQYFYKTTNGGETWSKKRFPVIFWSQAMYFINEQIGYVGHYRTDDSGETWQNVFNEMLEEYENINDYYFTDALHGWAISGESIFKTTDGGLTWQKLDITAYEEFIDIIFSASGDGWIVGWGGDILHKNKDSDEWQSKSIGPRELLTDVCFVNEREGWCIGEAGIILHTFNGGASWERQNSGTENFLKNIRFLNNNTGWIAGHGVVMHTEDAGITWENNPDMIENFEEIGFFDTNNGLLIEYWGNVYRTENGGKDWQIVPDSPFSRRLTSIAIVDENEAWIGGWQGLAHTVNKGESITWYEVPQFYRVDDIQFADKLHGCLINDMGDTFNTTNGGWEWVVYPRRTGMEKGPATSFFMLDNERSWFFLGAGSGYLKTAILNSEWTADTTDDYGVTDIHNIYFVNQNLGWAVGECGTILKYSGESTGIIDANETTTEAVKKNDRIHISPNPVHLGGTHITFQLQKTQNVTATVYNVLGQKVAILHSGYLQSGARELAWQPGNLASGIYFIRIECDDFTVSKKCIYIRER